jgi:hypothetical protein
VPEAASASPGTVAVLATRTALDALVVPARATACRIADDELLLLCDRGLADEIVREVATRVTVLDPDAVVVQTSDAWVAAAIVGEGMRELFAFLSRTALPDRGFVQGEVAGVPAKVVVEDGRITILVPSAFGDHVRGRLEAVGRELAP